jgi:hypothetical protein
MSSCCHPHVAEFTLNNNLISLNGNVIGYDDPDPQPEHPSEGSLQVLGYYNITDYTLTLTGGPSPDPPPPGSNIGNIPIHFNVNGEAGFPNDAPDSWNTLWASAWTHPVYILFEALRTMKRFVNGLEVAMPPLQSDRQNVSFFAGQKTCSDLKEPMGKDFFYYSMDCAMNSPGTLTKQTGSGGQSYGQNPV